MLPQPTHIQFYSLMRELCRIHLTPCILLFVLFTPWWSFVHLDLLTLEPSASPCNVMSNFKSPKTRPSVAMARQDLATPWSIPIL
ncbi:hypothetical protein BDZ91DRAFT_730808 [Kalaharituber pfeilii]|nr:hypothetical protein BDZ91DRAFT_730808 [Kalaharituber pfeilii]